MSFFHDTCLIIHIAIEKHGLVRLTWTQRLAVYDLWHDDQTKKGVGPTMKIHYRKPTALYFRMTGEDFHNRIPIYDESRCLYETCYSLPLREFPLPQEPGKSKRISSNPQRNIPSFAASPRSCQSRARSARNALTRREDETVW